jgi:glutaconate CoA-transferase, subunit B
MVLALSGFIKEGEIFATGVASPLPMIAAMFAKKTGKKFDYFNCGSGAVNPVIMEPAYSSVTINALEEKESFIEFLEVLDYASKGKIGLMFFGAVQISSNGDVNMTCIGNYRKPKVKLPGPAAAVTLRNLIKESILITQHHTKKTFVEKVDFVTSSTEKDTLVVTNLGVLRLGKKQEILTFFPHSSIEEIKSNTGFKLEDKFAKKSKAISEKDIEILNQIDPEGIRYRIS